MSDDGRQPASAEGTLEILTRLGATHLLGIPDNGTAPLFDRRRTVPHGLTTLTVTREGEAFAIASGLWLGGARPVVVIQNTGLLESGDALRGTAVRMGVPLLCLIGYRGRASMDRAGEEPIGPSILTTRRRRLGGAAHRADAGGMGPAVRARCRRRRPAAYRGSVGAGVARGAPRGGAARTGAGLMLTPAQLLEPLAALRRSDDVVVTSMSVVRPWGLLSDSDLDFASADSAMGHAADLALGIALGQPERRVICLNGDGSMLMCLGSLATIVDAGAANLRLIVVDNGGYEITGSQPVPAAGRVDYAALARASGFPIADAVDDADEHARRLPAFLDDAGPALLAVKVRPGAEPPISRRPQEPARYLQSSLHDWSRILRAALVG